MAEMQAVAGWLAYSAPPVDPSPHVRAALMRKISRQRPAAPATAPPAAFRPWPRLWAAAAAIALLLAGVATGYAVRLRGRVQSLEAENQRWLRQPAGPLIAPPAAAENRPPTPASSTPEIPPVTARPAAPPEGVAPAARRPALTAEDSERRLAVEALAAERQRVADLEKTVEEQTRKFQVASLEWAATQQRLQALVTDRERSLQERERMLSAYAQEVERLKKLADQYQQTLRAQQGEMEKYRQLASFLDAPDLKVLPLKGTSRAAGAAGHAFIANNRLLFYGYKLPALPGERTYQVWLIRRRHPAVVSGGVFQPDGQGRGSLHFLEPSLLTDITSIAVTDEPAGGSSKPTGHKFLIGLL